MTRDLTPDPTRRVVAHHGLRSFLQGRLDPGVRVQFRSAAELGPADPEAADPATAGSAIMDADVPLIVPALARTHVELLARLREQLPLTPILAVVNDHTDQQAQRALACGATSVLNVRQPEPEQRAILRMLCRGGSPFVGPVTHLWSVNGRAERFRSRPGQPADEPEADLDELLDLLSGPCTISTIAARLYCSERSLYRRVRRLYDALGVSGRTELRARMTDVAQPSRPGLAAAVGQ
jgi:DNA-binding NarL/FixJ family response regulator